MGTPAIITQRDAVIRHTCPEWKVRTYKEQGAAEKGKTGLQSEGTTAFLRGVEVHKGGPKYPERTRNEGNGESREDERTLGGDEEISMAGHGANLPRG